MPEKMQGWQKSSAGTGSFPGYWIRGHPLEKCGCPTFLAPGSETIASADPIYGTVSHFNLNILWIYIDTGGAFSIKKIGILGYCAERAVPRCRNNAR
jgi:hypothetical protein